MKPVRPSSPILALALFAAGVLCAFLAFGFIVDGLQAPPEQPRVVDGPVEVPITIYRDTWCPPPSMREDPEPSLHLEGDEP